MNPWLTLLAMFLTATLGVWALLEAGEWAKRRSLSWLAGSLEGYTDIARLATALEDHYDREAEAANRAAETFTDADWAALDEYRGQV